MRQIFLDTETTGLSPSDGHRLTEIGCIEMINRRFTGKRFQTYLNPEREIEKAATEITGLTLDFLRDKPKFLEVAEEFLAFINMPGTELIIHNAPFDLGFLNHELTLINHTWRPIENYLNVIDTLVMARRMHPGQHNNLDALCRRYRIDNTGRDYHGALLDADLLSRVYLNMTAGQTSMTLGTETSSSPVIETKIRVERIMRQSEASMLILRADEEELKIHLEKLAMIKERKESA